MTLGPLFLTEDKALRDLLKNMVVTDQKGNSEASTRPVGVWFGMPDQELREQNYPYITIDMIDVNEDRARSHRGFADQDYLIPDNLPADKGGYIDYPIPVNIDYQITVYSRHPRHDRQILSDLLFTRLPLRFGTLVPADDNTVRRLDVLDVAKRDTVEASKRLFINAITVRVSSEIPQSIYKELYKVQKAIISSPPLAIRGEEYQGFETITITE
jgi:hypothetical protein